MKFLIFFFPVVATVLMPVTSRGKTTEENGMDVSSRQEQVDTLILPHFYIDTRGQKINSKTHYTEAYLKIAGGSDYPDYEGEMKIRGRGNSTWDLIKKPFKIKLNQKGALLGLAAAKDWILLANYLDGSLSTNAIAMEMGRLLGMPYLFHMIPVDVTINGIYWGSYTFCEQKEVKKNKRIAVGKDGVLLELDNNFDEPPFQFKTQRFGLPVIVKNPQLEDFPKEQASRRFGSIKRDFDAFIGKIADTSSHDNSYLKELDTHSFVNYLILNVFASNREILNPRSVLIYRPGGGLYHFGPPWDFDRAFGFTQKEKKHFLHPAQAFWEGAAGEDTDPDSLWILLRDNPVLSALLKKRWNYFKENELQELRAFVRNYFQLLEASGTLRRDQLRWRNRQRTLDPVLTASQWEQIVLSWLNERAELMDKLLPGKDLGDGDQR